MRLPSLAQPDRVIARCGRPIVIFLSLAIYGLAMTGVPALHSLPHRSSGPGFPCQDHACGCRTAEQCWRDCCCFSIAERVAWSRTHGVEPPQFALAAARERAGSLSAAEASAISAANCCSRQGSASINTCCKRPTQSVEPNGPFQTAHAMNGQFQSKKKEGRSGGWVIGIQALKCRGLGSQWTGLGMPIGPPPRLVLFHFDSTRSGQVPHFAAHFKSHSSPPPVPPG